MAQTARAGRDERHALRRVETERSRLRRPVSAWPARAPAVRNGRAGLPAGGDTSVRRPRIVRTTRTGADGHAVPGLFLGLAAAAFAALGGGFDQRADLAVAALGMQPANAERQTGGIVGRELLQAADLNVGLLRRSVPQEEIGVRRQLIGGRILAAMPRPRIARGLARCGPLRLRVFAKSMRSFMSASGRRTNSLRICRACCRFAVPPRRIKNRASILRFESLTYSSAVRRRIR